MKKLKKLSLALAMVILSSLLMTACSSKDDGEDLEGDDCNEYLQGLAVDLSDKAQVFVENSTQANCQAVKNAGILLSEEAIECGYEEFETLANQYKDLDCSSLD